MIQIEEDNTYTIGSADNKNKYNIVYTDDEEYRTHNIAIKILDELENTINSAILCFSGFSGADESTYIADNQFIYVLAGKYLACLDIKELKLIWKSEADPSCCFGLICKNEMIIVHGEQVISCFNKSGKHMWEFYGRDIFATVTGKIPFEITENIIHLTDFNNDEYFLDFNGKIIKEKRSPTTGSS